MMRILTVALVAVSMLALAGVAQAEDGRPSQSTLTAMGLSGMQVMSDSQALEVRGMGYYQPYNKKGVAIAYGKSYAHVSGKGASAGSKDGFYAEGHHVAGGAHGSHAKIVVVKKKGRRGGGGNNGPQAYTNGGGGGKKRGGKVHVKAVKVSAGGYSFAYTK